MAEGKAIGALVKSGWKPRRTLVYTSWDGEEPGLLGSTEWAEAHAEELKNKAVLYVNSDTNSRGTLGAEGSHDLQLFVNEVARDVKDPETGASVLARAVAERRVVSYDTGRPAEAGGDIQLGALGSGSDFTPFLQHLGVNSLNVEFRGEADYGVYHSAYDSFDHFQRFVDPTFQYGIALAQVVGRVVLRAAQADLIPVRQSDFAASLSGYDDELHKLVDGMRAKSRELDALLDDGSFNLAQDPRSPTAPPPRVDKVPELDFAALDAAILHLQASAKAFDQEYLRLAAAEEPQAKAARARINAALVGLEQTLTDPNGLPGRGWYQHMIYAPGLHTGYGVKTLPGIREAIEERHWDEANQYVGVVARAVNAYSNQLDRAISAPGGRS
jgi:N-acetylated-alpha-linked acidic dipeptidase